MRPKLVDADEGLNHQIADTFASAGEADLRWTEKVWAAIYHLPSGYQIAFGLGKYTNRGVVDGFAGIAIGNDQWAVRASRGVGSTPDSEVGPIHYEVLRPLESVRIRLDEDSPGDFAFDVVFEGWVRPGVEARWPSHRGAGGLLGDVVRYHQGGTATGWVSHRGQRIQLDAADTPAFRDHSWGVRLGVGAPASDVRAEPAPRSRYRIWAPMRLERPDGSRYGLFLSYLREEHADGTITNQFEGLEELPSGAVNSFMMVRPELQFDSATRRLCGGIVEVLDENSARRPITISPLQETGFHIGLGGYYGGTSGSHHLGQWHGESWSDVAEAHNTHTAATVATIRQTRDMIFEVSDPLGRGTGYASIESILDGSFPSLGLE